MDPLGRFSDRVGDYVRHRPGYPRALIEFLQAHAGLAPGAAVADVGSGTGILTRMLLDADARVFAVEPNDAMRSAAEEGCRGRAGFASVKGRAEASGLADRSVSLITCAQAFHWFDPAKARMEFMRILLPGGRCALIWNTAILKGPFAAGYEAIKSDFGTDFKEIRHEGIAAGERLAGFFGPDGWEKRAFDNFQILNWDGLKGRLLSSSYAPPAGHPRHEPMIAALRKLYERCAVDGSVRMDYATELHLGRFS